MCGFTGWFGDFPPSIDVLKKMTASISHRGPDACGYFEDKLISLGHTRLSIIDIAASVQPMRLGKYVLVFNGEIYNFKTIRQELIEQGCTFQTDGDTEVLLHALIVWREKALEKLQGMFAFAFFDGKNLMLARDHLGVKPLYYAHVKNTIIFGSEIKALLEHPLISKEIDLESIALFMQTQYIPAPKSIYKQIKKLPSATILKKTKDELHLKKYWIPSYIPKMTFSQNEAVESLDAHLQRSVESMLVSDVEVGAFVSGGLDSSLIASMMQKKLNHSLNVFTIGFNNCHSEHLFAEKVASFIGAKFHPVIIGIDEIKSSLDQPFDEPFADQAALPTLLLSKYTQNHVKVVLTGEGADEVFGGYSNYQKRLKEAKKIQFLEKFFLLKYLYPILPEKLRKNRLIKALARSKSRRYTTIANLFDSETHQSIFTRAFYDASLFDFESLAERFYHECDSSNYLDKMLHIDQNLWLCDDLLTKVDRATMQYSIEARVPYLDHKLVEFAAKLPPDLKMGKNLLKNVAKGGYLPSSIVDRPKRGFVLPLHEWLLKDLRYMLDDHLNSLMQRNIFHKTLLSRKNHPTRLYGLLSLEIWFRKFAPNFQLPKHQYREEKVLN
jgi:asparagine synthase (glutamine-hydrolysing)